jgi:hypothetical protein
MWLATMSTALDDFQRLACQRMALPCDYDSLAGFKNNWMGIVLSASGGS